MKKITFCLMATCLSLSFHPLQSIAATATPSSVAASKPIKSAKAEALLSRLDEINDMDKSNLKFSEKRELKKEIRSIKHQLKEIGGGIYISAGAVIIILLLIILL